MILQSLYELYERLSRDPEYEISPPGYSLQKISFKIVLKSDGTLHAIENLRDPNTKRPRQMIMPGGDKPTGKITEQSVHKKVQLLRNSLPFLIGVTVLNEGESVLSESKMEFEAFKRYHVDKEHQINDSDFTVLCNFLRSWDPEKAHKHEEWRQFTDGQGVFQILGKTEYLHDRKPIRAWWDSHEQINDERQIAQCLITGKVKTIARLHEPKIKGVRGSQTSGAPIVAFDKDNDAFASYSRDGKQAFNAPVSKDAAFKYATTLNALLVGPKSYKHRFSLSDTTIVFWTKEPTFAEDIFAQFAAHGSTIYEKQEVQDDGLRQKIELFLKALREGKEAYSEFETTPDKTPFFILGLTGQAKGRIGVRFFYRDTISRLLDNLRRHYADMKIEQEYGENTKYPDPEFPALWQLLDETCPRRNGKPDRDKIPPILSGPLLRAVITGSQYPEGLYRSVIRRINADSIINYIRTCIIKSYLTRNQRKEVSMNLNTDNKEHAYRLGRLFAALEKIQEEGFYQQTGRRIEHTIRDSYFSSASATPAVVFPRLERLSIHHRRLLPLSRKTFFDKLIADIKWEQCSPKSVLNLSEQGVFIMGYYHQRKMLFTKNDDQVQLNKEE
jgi:CRISPR-associated protein Csd1